MPSSDTAEQSPHLDVEALWRLIGRQPLAMEPIGSRPVVSERQTYRLRFADGSVAKLRVLLTAGHAVAWDAVRSRLAAHPRLAARLAQQGRAVLEEWVEGEVLPTRGCSHGVLREAGAVLRVLHTAVGAHGCETVAVPVAAPIATSVADAVARLEAALDTLVAHAALPVTSASRLRRRADRLVPVTATTGIVHYDFCGPNLVRNASRGLVSIDHEWLHVGIRELDLARTCRRWALCSTEWEVFLEGYREGDRGDVLPLFDTMDFWLLYADAAAAALRVHHGWPDAAHTVAQLRRWDR
jgi:thiamine kinase-like enzyme